MDRLSSNLKLYLLKNEVLARVWISHSSHFRHNNPVCGHIFFVSVTSEKSAPVGHFTCNEQRGIKRQTETEKKKCVNNFSEFLPQTIFEGEAVYYGHAVKPVLVAGLTHSEDARAIAQQRALQPTGNVPFKININSLNRMHSQV